MKKFRKFLFNKLLDFVQFLIKKYDVKERDILDKLASLEQDR